MRTYVIGRSEYADIPLADLSVASRHVELVVTDDDRYHVTDCATENGTWRHLTTEDGSKAWHKVRQAFVDADESLRLGDHLCTVRKLLHRGQGALNYDGKGRWRAHAVADFGPDLPGGRVERDPLTGEIIRKVF